MKNTFKNMKISKKEGEVKGQIEHLLFFIFLVFNIFFLRFHYKHKFFICPEFFLFGQKSRLSLTHWIRDYFRS